MSWLYQAVYSQDGDCKAFEPSLAKLYTQIFLKMGKTPKEAEELLGSIESFGAGPSVGRNVVTNRGRIDGKPINVYDNPTSVPDDPPVNNVTGRYAPGFDLDGKGDSPNAFEDPETHEKGIDNQYFRAVGCFTQSRAVPPARPTAWSYGWDSQRTAMRAWLVSVSGEDLKHDGPVTVTIDGSLEPTALDARGNVQRDQTFRINPDPRTHNVYRGTLKDGVITIEPGGDFHMLGDSFVIPQWSIRNFHLRLQMRPDGTMEALLGGYQPWLEIYYFYAQGAFLYESMLGLNMPGIYYSLRRMADADPDPETKQNMSISVAYRIEALPALTIPPPQAKVSER